MRRVGALSPMRNRLVTWAWLVPLALVTWFAFEPALSAGFTNWDDGENFVLNQAYRGLSGTHLRWMFTTTHLGPYQPLSWVTLGLDHAMGGMDPRVYHRTNLVLHVAGAVAVFALARRFFEHLPTFAPGVAREALAFAAALLFAVHPLRCESVCWITERRDVLSLPFFCLSLGSWIGYVTSPRGTARGAYVLAHVWMLLSLLAKASAVVMPGLFLLADLWPFRAEARARGLRAVLVEKIPSALLATVFVVIAVGGQARDAALVVDSAHGFTTRAIQAGYAACFYVGKSLWPSGLIPIHEAPPLERFFDAPLLWPALVALLVSIGLVVLARRGRWRALALAWFAYLVILAPVSGIVQAGPQLVAERYSYHASVPLVLLAAAGLGWIGLHSRAAAGALLTLVVVLLFARTREQARIWHDTETLWNHTLSITPKNHVALANLGAYELVQGQAEPDPARALALLRRALDHTAEALTVRAEPRQCFNLAAAHFQLHWRVNEPNGPHLELARESCEKGRELARARGKTIEPRWTLIHALTLYYLGRQAEALPWAAEASAGLPNEPEAARLHANTLVDLGRPKEASVVLESALVRSPDHALLWHALACAAESAGDNQRAREAARSGVRAAERTYGKNAARQPWYADLARRAQ